MRTRTIFLFALIAIMVIIKDMNAQDFEKQKMYSPKLILDFTIVDFPYVSSAIQSRANYRAGTSRLNEAKVRASDYVALIESPSMYQVMALTTSYYNAMNYGIAVGWNRLVDPTTSKRSRIWNRIGKEFTAAIAFAATTKVPFAGGWAHEEFHRNTWGQYNIGSYNEIWKFNLAPDALSYVSHIQDEDLAWFKANDQAGFIRMGSSGIEAHFLTNERLQTEDFIYNTNLPNIALYWADVLAPLDYVNRAKSKETIEEHADLYNDESNQLHRDFTGNDFTAWVYDLFNSNEAYEERGVHPTGIGFDRYRDYNDLSADMLNYVEKMGNRQWINFVSPFMVGIRNFQINANTRFNFAFRHYLTSFGDDIQLELYLGYKSKVGQIVLHKYSNNEKWFPGLELSAFENKYVLPNNNALDFSLRAMGWLQPQNQKFMTNKAQLGGLLAIKSGYTNKTIWQPYIQMDAKTAGWVAGNPYLTDKISVRIGVRALIGK